MVVRRLKDKTLPTLDSDLHIHAPWRSRVCKRATSTSDVRNRRFRRVRREPNRALGLDRDDIHAALLHEPPGENQKLDSLHRRVPGILPDGGDRGHRDRRQEVHKILLRLRVPWKRAERRPESDEQVLLRGIQRSSVDSKRSVWNDVPRLLVHQHRQFFSVLELRFRLFPCLFRGFLRRLRHNDALNRRPCAHNRPAQILQENAQRLLSSLQSD